MVQDLTNPMLAQNTSCPSRSSTISVESNAMQFYPEASLPESKIHPGIYNRANGILNLETLGDKGFGYRTAEIKRELPNPSELALLKKLSSNNP